MLINIISKLIFLFYFEFNICFVCYLVNGFQDMNVSDYYQSVLKNKLYSENIPVIDHDNLIDFDDNDFEQDDRIKECDNRVHRKCVQVKYTDQDVENVRLYLMERFGQTGPVKPVCKKLFVRKDVKCLTKEELSELIDGFKQLYKNGVMDRYSVIHAAYWPATHKFAEGLPWHRWFVRQLEKELQKINPKLALPYWESYSEFAAPERSSIWDFLGTTGYPSTSFCLTDGKFSDIKVEYPRPHCITRQWNFDGTIPPYEGPEWMTSVTQTAKDWSQFVPMTGFTGHFKLHLSIGGYYGDYSLPWATNDPLFYIFHTFPTDLVLLKWQLSDDRFLVPKSYTGGNRLLMQNIVPSDVEKDTLAFYDNIKVKEAFQVGFGELCYIHDQLIRPINDIMHNVNRDQSISVKTLIKSLPKTTLNKYFPKFASNKSTFFDHFLPDIGNCPPKREKCKPMPIAQRYNETANGLRQLDRFKFDADLDLIGLVYRTETQYYDFMNELKSNKYCSPYVN